MLRVRFSSGLVVRYNDANYCIREKTMQVLYQRNGSSERWIANIPNDCLVEAVLPCSIQNPGNEDHLQYLENLVEALTKEIRSLKRKVTK